jgi:hypothetical protein
MIAASSPRAGSSVFVRSQDKDGVKIMKNPAQNSGGATSGDAVASSRRWFAALLWRAFPSPSERELADKAARVLDVSPRQVRNWLRCEHSAAWHYVAAVMAIAGVECVFRGVEPRR